MDIVVWRAASLLLTYPDQRFYDRRPMLRAALAELPDGPAPALLTGFLDHVDRTPPVRLAAHYMEVSRGAGLHLGDYGDHDQRLRRSAAACVRLAEIYRAAEWAPEEDERPDFLPNVLEYAALCADDWLLLEYRAELGRLEAALRARRSPYAAPVEAVRLTLTLQPYEGTRTGARWGATVRDLEVSEGQATLVPEPPEPEPDESELPELLEPDEEPLDELEESDLAVEDSDLSEEPFADEPFAEAAVVEADLPEPRLSVL